MRLHGGVTALTIGVALVVAACGSSSRAPAVQDDVSNLLLNKFSVLTDSVTCVHQVGNEYICQVRYQGGSQTLQVTDDGTSVFEQGFLPPG